MFQIFAFLVIIIPVQTAAESNRLIVWILIFIVIAIIPARLVIAQKIIKIALHVLIIRVHFPFFTIILVSNTVLRDFIRLIRQIAKLAILLVKHVVLLVKTVVLLVFKDFISIKTILASVVINHV